LKPWIFSTYSAKIANKTERRHLDGNERKARKAVLEVRYARFTNDLFALSRSLPPAMTAFR